MTTLTNSVPASLRTPSEPSRFAQNLLSRSRRPHVIAGPARRVEVLSKSRFLRLPQECEDARLTGMTRSLNRRLLALNVSGSLIRHEVLVHSRIA